MQRIMIRAKVHRATVIDADLHYEGSLMIDGDLLDAADLKPYEKVAVVNVNNGVFDADELSENFEPRIVFVDSRNRMTQVTGGNQA